ncbi:interleukin-1 alpha [Dasypus novemcinctus]|uniref:interleukin-1 alpha n=1 Tax=Dasypus novemcinctus TaxID=9361 RepID=UPI000328E3D2|nr:interleukin-1 alpha [Dasypus novemcinctus]
MATVPDLFEDLKSCCSENEDSSQDLPLDQQSFYDACFGPLPGDCMDKMRSLGTPDSTKTPRLTYEESVVLVTAGGKVLKRRRLSLNLPIVEDDLGADSGPKAEIKPRSAHYTLQSNVKYSFIRVIKNQFILNDDLAQSIIRDPLGPHLRAAALNNLEYAVKFDMGAYKPTEVNKRPVTLRISKTRLFVSAQDESEPVLLKEMPETPRIITGSETSLLFFWETYGTRHYFRSVTHPELLIATMEDAQVHMARGQPSITDFQIQENQA